MEVTPRHPERIAAARMAIINGDRLKAESLHFYCANCWGFDVVAVEFTGAAGIAAVSSMRPDVVLVSLSLPDAESSEILRELQAASPASRIIGQIVELNEFQLHRLGASGYHGLILDSDASMAALGETIERVRHGLRVIAPRIAQCQAALRASPDSFPKLLSPRELDTLVCIAHSFGDSEIGAAFGISAGTALSHRRKIMRKLGIHSTPKLIRYCVEKGFNTVPPPSRQSRAKT